MNLKIANPVRDSDLLESAQKEAFSIAKKNKMQAKILTDLLNQELKFILDITKKILEKPRWQLFPQQ